MPAVFNNSLMRSLNVCVLSSVLMSRRVFELAGAFSQGTFAEDWYFHLPLRNSPLHCTQTSGQGVVATGA
jgi:hypothetical protein